jgi:catechol 2,3-dioxygenase-like lactoylglutathione lyase family enzyme
MAKLLGPDFINLQVRDLAASRAFYTEVLGLTVDPRFSAPDVVVFDSTTIPFALQGPKVNLDEAPHRLRGLLGQRLSVHARALFASLDIAAP